MQPTRPPAPSAQADRDRSPRVAVRTGAFACVLSRTRARGRGSVVMKKGDFKDSPVTGMPRHATRSSVPPNRRATAPMYRRDAPHAHALTRAHSFARTRPGCSARLRARPMRAAACLPRGLLAAIFGGVYQHALKKQREKNSVPRPTRNPVPPQRAAPRRHALRCNTACVATQRALQHSVRWQRSVRCNTACVGNAACVATYPRLLRAAFAPLASALRIRRCFCFAPLDRSVRSDSVQALRCAAQVTFEPFQCVPLDIRAPTLESIDHVPPSGRTRTRTGRTRTHDSNGTWRARRHGLRLHLRAAAA
jgi:hypothetical protein